MSKLREMLSDIEYEVVSIRCKPIPFQVLLGLPEDVKEVMPRVQVKAIEGYKLFRFYCPPNPQDIIRYNGHVWKVLGLDHAVQKVGSPKSDRLPTVLTMYLGVE
jgi:hypothetical protein